jgi:hypothetical protein
MSERENIWVPKLKQYLADKKISRREFIRQSTLLGCRRRGLHVGRQDHRPAHRAPGAGPGSAARRRAEDRHAGAEGRLAAYLLVDLRLQYQPPGRGLYHPHRRRQHHPPAPVLRLGGLRRPQDLDLHGRRHQLAFRPAAHGGGLRLEPQARSRSRDRVLGGRHAELPGQGGRHRRDRRRRQPDHDVGDLGRQRHRGQATTRPWC